jgi:hypothetical protein
MSRPASPQQGTRAAVQQRRYSQQQKALRKPTRDDVARVALHWIIKTSFERNKEGELSKWSETIVKRLVRQGFDGDAARRRIDQLIECYEARRFRANRICVRRLICKRRTCLPPLLRQTPLPLHRLRARPDFVFRKPLSKRSEPCAEAPDRTINVGEA